MNHRAVQRTLFRMQFDSDFRSRMYCRDPAAQASTGLDSAELELLLAVPEAGVAADLGGRRSGQLLGNLMREFPLSSAACGADLDAFAFFQSAEFHDAVRANRLLVPAFGGFLERRAANDALAQALLQLEGAMVALSRAPREEVRVPDCFTLAPDVAVVELPAGTLAFADALGAAIINDAPLPARPVLSGDEETALISSAAPPSGYGRRVVRVEGAEAAMAAVLGRARHGLDAAGVAAIAAAFDAAPADVAAFIHSLVDDGVLRAPSKEK